MPVHTMEIAIELSIAASPDRVFAALTTGTALWWGAPFLENRNARDLILEPWLNGRLYECWGLNVDDKDGALLGTVIAISRPNLIKFQGTFGLSDRIVRGIVSFSLDPDDGGTKLAFWHKAIGEIDDAVRERYKTGWTELLERLKELMEVHRGHGVRHDPTLPE